MDGETLIAMAQRHVREGHTPFEKQKAISARSHEQELPLDEAERLLSVFEGPLAYHERQFAEIIGQQDAYLRGKNGNVIIKRKSI